MARRSKHRSVQHQFQHAIVSAKALGASKKGDRENGVTEEKIYSGRRADGLKETANQFSKYIKENYPEIRYVRDITSEMAKAWIDSMEKDWSPSTKMEHVSRLGKIERIVAQEYHLGDKYDLTSDLKYEVVPLTERERIAGMAREDAEKLAEYLEQTESGARYIPGIVMRIGARAEEANLLEPWQIDLDKQCVHLTHCKNGRNRDVPIRREDLQYFEKVKTEMDGYQTVAGGIALSSQSTAVRRALDTLGLSEKYPETALHAVRKLYAKERYEELREDGMTGREAWSEVQQEIGHGAGHREHLYQVYIGCWN